MKFNHYNWIVETLLSFCGEIQFRRFWPDFEGVYLAKIRFEYEGEDLKLVIEGSDRKM